MVVEILGVECDQRALLGRERRPAPTRRRGIGVLDGEPSARNRVDEVDLGVFQILDADRVHEQLHPVGFEDLIAGALSVLVDHQAVLEARAAPALHEHSQTAASFLLFDQEFVDLRCRGFRYVNHDPIISVRGDAAALNRAHLFSVSDERRRR